MWGYFIDLVADLFSANLIGNAIMLFHFRAFILYDTIRSVEADRYQQYCSHGSILYLINYSDSIMILHFVSRPLNLTVVYVKLYHRFFDCMEAIFLDRKSVV